MMSSTCGQLASYPLALVRTKLQANGMSTLSFELFLRFSTGLDSASAGEYPVELCSGFSQLL